MTADLDRLPGDLEPDDAASAVTPREDVPDDAAVPESAVEANGPTKRRVSLRRLLVRAVLPGLALVLALTGGYFKWLDVRGEVIQGAGTQAKSAATAATVAMLSYSPATAQTDLERAQDLLTGDFKRSYSDLVRDVVIPGAIQKQVTSQARIAASAVTESAPDEAKVLLFINQTITMGNGAPTDTASSVRVTLDKVSDRWLISNFEPV